MVVRKIGEKRTRGAVAVETAFVMILFTSVIFGIFEFCRFFMDWNILNNAAREGCRYAVVNNTNTTISTDVATTVNTFMGAEVSSFSNLTVTVSGSHNGTSTAVNSLSAGDMVTVTVSGTYKFMNVIPIYKMPTTLTITTAVTMGCEGGT